MKHLLVQVSCLVPQSQAPLQEIFRGSSVLFARIHAQSRPPPQGRREAMRATEAVAGNLIVLGFGCGQCGLVLLHFSLPCPCGHKGHGAWTGLQVAGPYKRQVVIKPQRNRRLRMRGCDGCALRLFGAFSLVEAAV